MSRVAQAAITLPSLDELTGAFIGALDTNRGSIWHAGDVVCRAIAEMANAGDGDGRKFKRARAKLYKTFASAGHCTTSYVRQLGEVSGTFGTEQRYPDQPWGLFRAVRNAALRLKEDPRELLDRAVEQAWGVSDVNALGKAEPIELVCTGSCGTCGASVRVKLEGTGAARADRHSLRLPCPVCVVESWAGGTDGFDVDRVGELA